MIKEPNRMQRELIGVRDTIESIWVAIILAFILRAFMVEAFVIPTGSMAPRLMGQHFEIQCPRCGLEYAYTGPPQPMGVQPIDTSEKHSVNESHCPNCGKVYDGPKQFLNSGDRVLVMKFLYNFTSPKPWDVVVFRNPQDNDQNYIKRLVGLPSETIMLVQGDVFVKTAPSQPFFHPRRKDDPRIQEAMWQVIYDNDYRPDGGEKAGEEPAPQWTAQEEGAWNLEAAGGRHFEFAGTGGHEEWKSLAFGSSWGQGAGRWRSERDYTRELFLPNYGYNTYYGYTASGDDFNKLAYRDVCSDLNLSVRYVPLDGHGRVSLTTTSFRNAFRAVLGADGTVKLQYAHLTAENRLPAEAQWQDLVAPGRLKRPVPVGKGCRLALTHTDYRLTVWVDGKSVLQTTDKDYTARAYGDKDGTWWLQVLVKDKAEQVLKAADFTGVSNVPTPQVRIAAAAGPCRLEHVQLYRDVYYTGHRVARAGHGSADRPTDPRVIDFARRLGFQFQTVGMLPQPILPDGSGLAPLGWGVLGNPITLQKDLKAREGDADGNEDLDSFMVLGDNSPCSLDSRAWIEAAPTLRLFARGDTDGKRPLYQIGTVPRYNMIGKALFVYWPAGHRLPGLPRLPIVPNVGRMRLIR